MLIVFVITTILLKQTVGFNNVYWIWIIAGILIYLYLKDIFTGLHWFEKPLRYTVKQPTAFQQQLASMPYADFVATLPALNETEKQGYVELTACCVAEPNRSKWLSFFNTLKDFSTDPDYMTTLNYVIEYGDENDIPFIMSLDWKASIEDLEWRLHLLLQQNFSLTLPLPQPGDYPPRTSISTDGVFKDFDKPLRSENLQMGFIHTDADQYVIVVHKSSDKVQVSVAIRKVGYDYYEV